MPCTEVILLHILTPWPMLLDPRFAEVGSACGTIVSMQTLNAAFCFIADSFLTVSNMHVLVHCHRSTRRSASIAEQRAHEKMTKIRLQKKKIKVRVQK